MPDSKITALTSIGTSTDPANDPLVLVDVSDTSMAATGTTKKVTLNQLLATSPTATLASATITGDLTVDTSTLKVDSAANKVGIGTTTIASTLTIRGSLQTNADYNLQSYYKDNASTWLGYHLFRDDGVNYLTVLSAQPWAVQINGSERFRLASDGVATWSNVGGVAGTAMTLNSTGLGVGRTPSAWNALYKGLVVGGTSGNTIVLAGNDASIGTGYYLSGAGIYNRDNGSATVSSINMYNRAFVFRTAASGTVDSAITWTDSMTLTASGDLLVGKTASSTTVAGSQVQTDGTHSAVKSDGNPGFFYNTTTAISGTIALFRSNGVTVGSISQDGTNTAYNNSSDYRLKESVQPLTGGLDRVNALKPSIYKWKTNGKVGEGFLAHELAEVVPFAVTGEKDAVTKDGEIEPQQVDLSKVVPILVAAIKELTARVEALEA